MRAPLAGFNSGPTGGRKTGMDLRAASLGHGAARLIDTGETAVIGAIDDVGLGHPLDHALIDHDLGDVAHRGQLIHGIEQHRLQDRAQAAGARLALHGPMGNRLQRIVAELELGPLHLEQPPILLGQGVLRVRQNGHQRTLVELIERRNDRKPADELRDEAVFDEVFRLHVMEEIAAVRAYVDVAHLGGEADPALLRAVEDDLLQSRERPAADEEDIAGIDLQELLLRVLAPALGRHRGDGPLDELQQGLLHALPGDIPGNRRIVGFARDLVDLVDVDDTGLRLLDVVVALLEQLLNDVLDVLADIPRLCQGRGIGDREGHVEQPRQGLREQRLAAAGGPDEQDVALGDLDVLLGPSGAGAGLQPLVMVVDGDREYFLRALLPDHVLVENLLDLVGLRQLVAGALGAIFQLLANDVVAELDAFVANEHGRAGDELADLMLALPAEGAVEELAVIVAAAGIITHRRPSCEAVKPLAACIACTAPVKQSTWGRLSRCSDGICMTAVTEAADHS